MRYRSIWDALCSQHFEYGSNCGHVTFGIQKLVEREGGSLPGEDLWTVYMVRCTGGGSFNESIVDNAARCSCMLSRYILKLIQGCCSLVFPTL